MNSLPKWQPTLFSLSIPEERHETPGQDPRLLPLRVRNALEEETNQAKARFAHRVDTAFHVAGTGDRWFSAHLGVEFEIHLSHEGKVEEASLEAP